MSEHPFLTTYAAVRFSTGKKAPSITGNLLRAAATLLYAGALLIPALFQAVRYLVWLAVDHSPPPPRPAFNTGRPRRFEDSVADLQEDMLA
jgi:hypothetical protein